MKVWQFLLSKLECGQRAVLLYVLDNKGSSPGRKGFLMAIASDGQFIGTIGGGIMEVKLLELAKSKLSKREEEVLIKKQYHDKHHTTNQSGLICSGEQTVAIIPLSKKSLDIVRTIVENFFFGIKIGIKNKGIELINASYQSDAFKGIIWLNQQNRVHIFGAGHVGTALSQVLALLDYNIFLYDDRPTLQGFMNNPFVDEVKVVQYEKIDDYCNFNTNDSIIIVSSSYRSDKQILKQLHQQQFSYIGMMGSDEKLNKLYKDFGEEGININQLSHIKAPIGMPIYSKTAMEIAISIAGEMIYEKNKGLPTGRGHEHKRDVNI